MPRRLGAALLIITPMVSTLRGASTSAGPRVGPDDTSRHDGSGPLTLRINLESEPASLDPELGDTLSCPLVTR